MLSKQLGPKDGWKLGEQDALHPGLCDGQCLLSLSLPLLSGSRKNSVS